jgi:glycosyltransferase involved in cell wall biosynthesis
VINEPNIDPDKAARPAVSRSALPFTILCAGRLVAQKNFMLAIHAFAQVNGHENLRLLILGEGKQRGLLEAEIDRLGLYRQIILGGHVADIGAALSEAGMMLLSSRYEGYPAVLVEALAAGVPIVATDCSPAISEILSHPSFGQIVPADAAAMARAIERQCEAGPPDPASVAGLVERHRIDRVGEQYLDLFDGLCVSNYARRSHAQSPAQPGRTGLVRAVR